MGNYATADLIKYQAKITQKFQAGELRWRFPSVFASMRASTEIMIPSHNEIKYAAKRTTGEVNYFNRTLRALGTGGEIYNHAGVVGDSSVLVPAWTPYDDKFKYSIKQANSSIYSLDDELMSEMTNVMGNFSEGLETAAATYINTNRSGVNVRTTSSEGTFSAINDVFEITVATDSPLATGYRIVQIMKSTMEINKWTAGNFLCYCDTIMFDKLESLSANGAGNNVNSSFQFSGVSFIKSVELDALAAAVDATYVNGYAIMVQNGNLATMEWIPVQNRNGVVGPNSRYGTLIHPQLNLQLATHEYTARADESAGAGENQDVKVETQIFDYISFNHAPLTTADETPLQAFALK